MRALFISYRRDDAEGQAGRLFDDLIQHFGTDAVFMDVAAIEPGRDFRVVIDEHVASCGVLLAIIGSGWLTATDESGSRRLDNPADFVRLETASALKRDIPVVPVLVHGARMPRAEDLPEDLKELAFRNAVELTHARWTSDVQVLVMALQPYVRPKPEPIEPPPMRNGTSWMVVAGLVGALVLVLGGYFLQQRSATDAASETQAPKEEQRLPAATPAPVEVEKLKSAPAAPKPDIGQMILNAARGTGSTDATPKANSEIVRNLRAGGSVPTGHRLIGKWYNRFGNGPYVYYEFTGSGLFTHSSSGASVSGTFDVDNDNLTIRAPDDTVTRYTIRFECLGVERYAEQVTLRDNATRLETSFIREPTGTGPPCK